jgi:hypothetical protein
MKTRKLISPIFFLMIMIAFIATASGCNTMPRHSNEGGNTITETRPVTEFTGIKAGGAFKIFIKQGDTYALSVEAEKDILPLIETKVTGKVLEIQFTHEYKHWMGDNGPMNIYVTVKTLDNLDLSGACEVETQNMLTVPSLGLDISGAVEARLSLSVQKLDMVLSGASELKLSGKADAMRLDASGASEVDAYSLESGDVTLFGSGAIDAKITANTSLKANVSGACDVRYKGNPRVDVSSSGASSIKRAD